MQEKTKKSIVLCMIVKNEAHIILDTLKSYIPYIDYYVINDTGSTDNTVQVIKEYFDLIKIDGIIVTHEYRSCADSCHGKEWKRYSEFHFGWNRTFSLNLCYGKGDYIWVADADAIIHGNLILPELTEDAYLLKIGNDCTFNRMHIFKNDPSFNWKYIGALHEYPHTDKNTYSTKLIDGDYWIESSTDRIGERSSMPNKYLKDALFFERLILEEPNNDRYIFYCARSYFDHGDYANAIVWYAKTIQKNGWFEEVYYAYYQIALAMAELNCPWSDVEEAFLDAYNFCKIRSEPLYHIAHHYRLIGDYETAYKYASIAINIPYPTNLLLFIHKSIYDYKILEELLICVYNLGHFEKAIEIGKIILSVRNLPQHYNYWCKDLIMSSARKLANQQIKLLDDYMVSFYAI